VAVLEVEMLLHPLLLVAVAAVLAALEQVQLLLLCRVLRML
jgi:hypothetical protein